MKGRERCRGEGERGREGEVREMSSGVCVHATEQTTMPGGARQNL